MVDIDPQFVFPRRDLPGRAEEWGRTVEDQIRSIKTAITVNDQFAAGNNRNSASTIEDIARQIQGIETAQADILAAQSQITATQSFLLGQTSFASNPAFFSETNAAGSAVHGWSATYDTSISLTSSSTGVLWITVGALFAVNGLGNPWVGVEVIEGVTTVVSPDRYLNGAGFGSSVGSQIMATNAQKSILVTVTPNTAITVRSRRGRNNNTPTSTGTIASEAQTLSVTKVGI